MVRAAAASWREAILTIRSGSTSPSGAAAYGRSRVTRNWRCCQETWVEGGGRRTRSRCARALHGLAGSSRSVAHSPRRGGDH